ncbi:MAG TPA: matrixin family metalloprotease, partial [Polyangiales bacterium]
MALSFVYPSPVHAYELLTTDHGDSVHWQESAVTLRIAQELEDYFAELPVVDAIHQAVATWTALEGVPELLIERGCFDEPGFQRGKSSNGVYLIRDWDMVPNALAVTITTFETESGRLVDSDVLVNANFAFSWLVSDEPETGRYDLPSVLTHEIGHVLGLGDTPDVPDATMWPSIVAGDVFQRDLAPDDEAGATSIYAAQPEADPGSSVQGGGCGGASLLNWHPRARGGRTLVGALFVLVSVWLCARSRAARSLRRPAVLLGGVLLFGGLTPSPAAGPPHAPPREGAQQRVAWLPRDHPRAEPRLAQFVSGADRIFKARARTRVERRGGLIWTRVHTHSSAGGVEFEVLGGSLDGVTQLVSGHAPPRDGEQLVIAWRKHGPHAWAHLRDGVAYGGSLGE